MGKNTLRIRRNESHLSDAKIHMVKFKKLKHGKNESRVQKSN